VEAAGVEAQVEILAELAELAQELLVLELQQQRK